jgi:hypothetical protein
VIVTIASDITEARHIIEENELKLAEMRRQGVSEERIATFVNETDAWKQRLQNLEAAKA